LVLFSVQINIVKEFYAFSCFNLCAAFCKLPSVSAIITWSSANNRDDKCSYFR
jgi:hypothetical protein